MPRQLLILGSTGSIGTQALELIGRNRDRFHVLALSAGGDNVALLAEQALEFEVVRTPDDVERLGADRARGAEDQKPARHGRGV